MFNDANGEHIFVYAKMEPFIPDLRENNGRSPISRPPRKDGQSAPDSEARLDGAPRANQQDHCEVSGTSRSTAAAAPTSQSVPERVPLNPLQTNSIVDEG